MKDQNIDLNPYFTNFLSAIHDIRQTVEDKMKERGLTDPVKAQQEITDDLFNVEVNRRLFRPEFTSFCDEFDLNESLKTDAAKQLLKIIEETRSQVIARNFHDQDKRITNLNHIESIVYKVFGDLLEPKPILKLKFNADKVVIYDLIKQLKNSIIHSNTKFITQSNDEIAQFFIQYVDGFENADPVALSKEFSRQQIVKKRHFSVSTEG